MNTAPLAALNHIPPHLQTIADYQKQAQLHLNAATWANLEGAAGDEYSLNNNRAAFANIQLLPRHLNSFKDANTQIQLLGKHYPHPIFLAPVAYQQLFHPQGEIATAQAASAMQAPMILSHLSTTSMATLDQVSSAPKWFQLYWQGSRETSLDLVLQAQHYAYQAIVLTVDTPHMGIRDRERRAYFQLPAHIRAVHHHPVSTIPLKDNQHALFDGLMQQAATWEDIAWLVQHSPLPILLKGILHPADAQQAYQYGVQGIIVSNHGGRVLDTTVSPIQVLSTMRKILPHDFPILLDSGIRRGTDIFKALALGANAVLIGRPYIYGLAVAGALGAAHSIKLLKEEFEVSMALMGTSSIEQINNSYIYQK
ncbi:alpha-hydroxy acid oxidase [Acinetobacter sp. A1]|uniref:alpha-hydroxy acid oxidase n=1 Tax=Acinetobacter sp. A1 TaxID=401467 RepID=UPI001445FAD6|nr:alpha-hydroxy acid oxidase [Acinetobacter sp. A1]